jgi:hypothetical protein
MKIWFNHEEWWFDYEQVVFDQQYVIEKIGWGPSHLGTAHPLVRWQLPPVDSPVDLSGASRRFVAKPKESQNASREVMPQNDKLV